MEANEEGTFTRAGPFRWSRPFFYSRMRTPSRLVAAHGFRFCMFRLRRMECSARSEENEKSSSAEYRNARLRALSLSKRLREMPRHQWRWKKAARLDVLLQHETHEFHR